MPDQGASSFTSSFASCSCRRLANEYIAIVELRPGELERLRRAASTLAAAGFNATRAAADIPGKDVAGEMDRLNSQTAQ